MNQDCQKLLEIIEKSSRIVVFTGAGISTESGIPDYRSQGGLWDRYRPVYFQEFLASETAREEYWRRKKELYQQFVRVSPNKGHKALVRLEKKKKLKGIITQNIDGLHQEAGTSDVFILEIHGNNRWTICLSCGKKETWDISYKRLKKGEKSLNCLVCGGVEKPMTVSFGENLDPLILQKAVKWSKNCDLMIAVGSTLLVEPAASLPRLAKESDASLGIITLSDTPLDSIADVVIHEKAGDVLDRIIS